MILKKIFRFALATAAVVTKCVPQGVAISILSEAVAYGLGKLIEYANKKEKQKALEKIGENIVFVTKALVKHSDSDFDNELFKQVEKKTKVNLKK